ILFTLSLLLIGACTSTPECQGDWSVSRSNDPVTGIERCVVAVTDRFGSDRSSRMGSLYPFVERNSSIGLLVGVSSGGRYRLPADDACRRLDANPLRELKMSDTPAIGPSSAPAIPMPVQARGNPEAEKAFEDAMAMSTRLMSATTSGVTAVSGGRAEEMFA